MKVGEEGIIIVIVSPVSHFYTHNPPVEDLTWDPTEFNLLIQSGASPLTP